MLLLSLALSSILACLGYITVVSFMYFNYLFKRSKEAKVNISENYTIELLDDKKKKKKRNRNVCLKGKSRLEKHLII